MSTPNFNMFEPEEMSEHKWSKKVPAQPGYYWARWGTAGAEVIVKVDPNWTVWSIGSEVTVNLELESLLIGPRIPYLWE